MMKPMIYAPFLLFPSNVAGFVVLPTYRPQLQRLLSQGVDNEPSLNEQTNDVDMNEQEEPAFDKVSAEPEIPKLVSLNEEEDAALRKVSKLIVEEFGDEWGDRWYDNPAAWTKIKTDYLVLEKYSDGELRRAYFNQSPSLMDVLLKTPVGPVVGSNLLAMVYNDYKAGLVDQSPLAGLLDQLGF